MAHWRAALILSVAASGPLRAETGADAWLRHAPLPPELRQRVIDELPDVIAPVGDSPIVQSAAEELICALRGMTGRTLRLGRLPLDEPAIVLTTSADGNSFLAAEEDDVKVSVDDGFTVRRRQIQSQRCLVVEAPNDRGVLYGAFALLRRLACGTALSQIDLREEPYAPIRMVNHWDNLDGTIERGYAGRSIFWEDGHVREDLSRVRDYARLLASVGINGCSINNVNADVRVITPEYLPELARIAEAMRPWGVRIFVSLNFAAPRDIGGVDTFDPLDERAVAFWKEAIDGVYQAVPDLGGFVLKADSEGRLGPSEYGRTHADAANAIARAAKPHGGVLFYRGFVYNHRMDWRDLSLDRAKAAYDNFHELDGRFDDNVIIQIKHGPIDFQVREPASPLFGGLEQTNQAIELQITQEYLGQQKHLCYIAPMWKEVLDFDMHAGPPDASAGTPVKDLVSGRTFQRTYGGFIGVSNVGRDDNWLGHHLAAANLYAFGRLAWNPDLDSRAIAEEWVQQTFGLAPHIVHAIVEMLEQSWPTYERYTGNLGIGTLTDIIHIHFGPAPESSEYNGWGQWHRANDTGVGMDRTVATGTGFTAQYRAPVAEMFESLATCPDELLLFMQHVPYVHKLRNGKTVIQHFYDEHYDGAEQAQGFVDAWNSLVADIDEQRHREVLERLEFQAGHAVVWRDAICRWFRNKSGIDDQHQRVDNYPHRHEAEELNLTGYEPFDVTPWEAASNSRGVHLPPGVDEGVVTSTFPGPDGWYDMHVQYFDEEDGVSTFRVYLAQQLLDEWHADDHVPTPSDRPDAHTSSRRTIRGLPLRAGDAIRIVGVADGGERAALDYVEILPVNR
ncbi:MAG TPA: alpha-glucuronidase family glycosyl hydrolase [Lacipirellulaceae bacterium]|nr:alpha-glucuronidase family glycosyl hydrolase [Lacipirellulaceae bacterium]